jgi:hypothetical protein
LDLRIEVICPSGTGSEYITRFMPGVFQFFLAKAEGNRRSRITH